MGTSSCKTRADNDATIRPGCTCQSHNLSRDFELVDSQVFGGEFAGDERAETAEIARIIEALARPPTGGPLPGGPEEDPSHCWKSPSVKTSKGVFFVGEDQAEGELRSPTQRSSPGLSVLDVTATRGNGFMSCSADRFFDFELCTLQEELPEMPNSSLAFNRICRRSSNDSEVEKPRGHGQTNPWRRDENHAAECKSMKIKALHLPKAIGSNTCTSPSLSTATGGNWEGPSRESDMDTVYNCNLKNVFTLPQHILTESSARNCVNGSLCVGQWNGNLLDGCGIERWPDGSVFIGDFRSGKKHGDGRLSLASGSSYDGEFQDDAMHGEGFYLWKDGRGYSGQWTHGDVGPNGTMRWSDGRTYEGHWHEGHMHGFGKFQWPDGRHFAGQWVSGRQHGTGIVRNMRGHERQSLWKDGVFARWLTEPSDEESAAGGDELVGSWEVSVSTPHPSPRSSRHTAMSSPERGHTPRWSPRSPRRVGEVSLMCEEVLPLDVESCTLGLCKADAGRNIEL